MWLRIFAFEFELLFTQPPSVRVGFCDVFVFKFELFVTQPPSVRVWLRCFILREQGLIFLTAQPPSVSGVAVVLVSKLCE